MNTSSYTLNPTGHDHETRHDLGALQAHTPDYLAEIPGRELGTALASLNDHDPRVREAARAWSIVGPLMGKALSQTQLDEYTRANVNRFQQALGDPPRSIPGYDYPLTDQQRTEFFDHPATERRAAA